MTNVTDEALSAYIDGELPPEQRTAVERALEADGDARNRLQLLRDADATLREAFPLPAARRNDPIADHIRNTLQGAQSGRGAPLRGPAMALAAGLAGLAIGFFASDSRSAGDAFAMPATVRQVLETRASGDVHDGARVIFSFTSDNATPCRQFATETASFSGEGVACRDGSNWRLVAWVEADKAAPGDFHTAAGVDALDAVVERLDRSGPLPDDVERALLERGWRP
jgi:hypothetical protein